METTFLELKCKQVINVVDGKTLGRIIDMVVDVKNCKILGLIVPSPTTGWLSCFKSGKEIFIPFDCVCKIGIDVILVELYINNDHIKPLPPNKPSTPKKDCDKQC
ncbi:MAG: YlmC/YmxH family sporulation protein [Clostridia bacterium]